MKGKVDVDQVSEDSKDGLVDGRSPGPSVQKQAGRGREYGKASTSTSSEKPSLI